MNKRFIFLILILVIILILIWYFVCRKPVPERPPILLKTGSGLETTEFQAHDAILFDAVALSPRTGYAIQVTREDGEVICRLRLSTDQQGRIPETVIWYNVGIRPCTQPPAHTVGETHLAAYGPIDYDFVGRNYTLRIIDGEQVVREMQFRVGSEMRRPVLYAADARGCPRSGFLIGEEDVWVVGQNFPSGSIIRLWAVPASSQWQDGDRLEDMTKQHNGGLPPVFELKGQQTGFKRLLWPAGQSSIGSYDIAAEVVSYPFGSYHAASTAEVQNVVSTLSYSGFVIQRRPGTAEPLEMNVAGSVHSPFTFRDTFLTSENVYVGVDPCVQPAYVGKSAKVYIVADKTDAQWTQHMNDATDTLDDDDVTGTVEIIAVGGICGNCWKVLAWSAPLTPGKYDVVLDFNKNGRYDPLYDLIDSLDHTGFVVSEIRVDSISFNYSGSGAVTIYDNVSQANIGPPEYTSASIQVRAAAWVMGGSHTVRVDFKAVSSLNSAKIWAEIGLGGLNSSTSPVSVTFSGGSGQAYFNVNNPPAYVAKHLFDWQWKYKDVNGASTASQGMGKTGKHVLYTVLAAPQVPQAVPWLEALDIACDLANGRTTATDAARDIWYDFYHDAGGLYDTYSGSPQYTGKKTQDFKLTQWLSNYGTANIGTVNCYDMGKAVVVFANAIGCGTEYVYTDPFGYLNCVKPIGRGWTNNPFYAGPYASDPNPIVDGDAVRSSFGNHGFSRLNGLIYDGSGGQVDVGGDPDFGPPHTPWDLDGADSWTGNYKGKVIDNVPASYPGTPTPYQFIVK
jgi:hypothetical protein